MRRGLQLTAALLAVMATGTPAANAAGAPKASATWVTTVLTTSANLHAEADPNGLASTYRFEYISEASYQANLAASKDGFTGAAKAPPGPEPSLGSGEGPVSVVQHIGALAPATSYRYRVVATNTEGPTLGPARPLRTDEATPTFSLPDNRAWELVSPLDKNGGQIAKPEALFGGGVIQAAAQGGALTYGSSSSFAGAQGNPGASQYLSQRQAGGWSAQSLNVALYSGSYPSDPDSGVPYRLFSTDLASALLSNGKRCRGDATQCPVANPPLAGSGAPAGYRNYYLRNGSGSFKALLTAADIAHSTLGAEDLEVSFAGATADLAHVVLSSCAALTAGATEVPGTEGECDPAKPNLYEWSPSTGLDLINTAPGATLAAQSAAISTDGNRVYFSEGAGLFLREGATVKQVDDIQGGGGTFQTASADGSIAFFLKAEHIYRYLASTDTATDITPGGGVKGVLGASADGSYLYYLDAGGVQLWHSGTTTPVAPDADASNYPPATGTARVSADGAHLAFSSSAELTGFDPDGFQEIYLYSAQSKVLTCASCNPSGERPVGSASIPGAIANGKATRAYKPRVLSSSATRLFFESLDPLVIQDTNGEGDVYQWEAQGAGSCTTPGGCISLISSGRSEEGATFLDASADGNDAFFLTDGPLVSYDPGAVDAYDARVGGGLPAPPNSIPCIGDACQVVPGEPEDPTPGTVLTRPEGNPALSFPKEKKKKHHKKKHHKKHSGKGHANKHGKGR